MSDYYNVLGIAENASKEDIKKAYRSLQMKWHPDRNHGNQEASNMTQKINEAYETLSDPGKRQEYDDGRNNPFLKMAHGHPGGAMDVPMDDIISMLFGGIPGMSGIPGMHGMPGGARIHVFNASGGGGVPMGFHQALQKPTPVMKTLHVTMEQVLSGATIPLDIERWVIENGIKVHEQETIYVSVPQGIDDGEIIVLRDKGNVASEHQKGDVKVFVKVTNETEFKRSGLDLIYDKKISLKESLCGFSFDINYLNGKSYTLNNNKGNIIPPEYKKVYPGMGLTRNEHKGNLIIHFHVDFPESLSIEQIDRLKEVL